MNKKELQFYKEVDRKIKNELEVFSKEALKFVEQKLKNADLKTKNQVKENIENNIDRIIGLINIVDLKNIPYDSPQRKENVIREAQDLLKEICIFVDILTGKNAFFGYNMFAEAHEIKQLFELLKHRVYIDNIFYCLKKRSV